jgi:hypothetical protein
MISQAEVRRLKKRVAELEDVIQGQRRKWATTYPGGVCLGTLQRGDDWLRGRIEGVRLLGHAVVVTEDNDGKLRFYALPAAKC